MLGTAWELSNSSYLFASVTNHVTRICIHKYTYKHTQIGYAQYYATSNTSSLTHRTPLHLQEIEPFFKVFFNKIGAAMAHYDSKWKCNRCYLSIIIYYQLSSIHLHLFTFIHLFYNIWHVVRLIEKVVNMLKVTSNKLWVFVLQDFFLSSTFIDSDSDMLVNLWVREGICATSERVLSSFSQNYKGW